MWSNRVKHYTIFKAGLKHELIGDKVWLFQMREMIGRAGSNTQQHVAELLYLVTDTKTPSVTLPPPLSSDPRVKSGQRVFHNPTLGCVYCGNDKYSVSFSSHASSPPVTVSLLGNKQTNIRIATLNQSWLYLHPLADFVLIYCYFSVECKRRMKRESDASS